MESGIIKFYSGSAQQVANITTSNCIIFNQTDGSLSWKHNGQRYYIAMPAKVNADWNQNDPTQPSYIKNKPIIPDYAIPTDLNQLSDSTHLVHTYRKAIPSSSVDSYKKFMTNSKKRPSQLITNNGTMHSIQTDSLELDNSDNYIINLTRYLAYQNKVNVPASGWYLLYNGGPV